MNAHYLMNTFCFISKEQSNWISCRGEINLCGCLFSLAMEQTHGFAIIQASRYIPKRISPDGRSFSMKIRFCFQLSDGFKTSMQELSRNGFWIRSDYFATMFKCSMRIESLPNIIPFKARWLKGLNNQFLHSSCSCPVSDVFPFQLLWFHLNMY